MPPSSWTVDKEKALVKAVKANYRLLFRTKKGKRPKQTHPDLK